MSEASRSEDLEIAPSRTAAWLGVAAGLLLLGLTAAVPPVGRLLLVPAGLLLVALGIRDLVLRPTLQADHEGLTVVDGLHRRKATWETLERLRVVHDRRAQLLELDLGDTVVVLSRRRLGQPPYLVFEQLELLRPDPPP